LGGEQLLPGRGDGDRVGTVAAVISGSQGSRTSDAGTSDTIMGRPMPTPERTLTW
jgi:hypothetical protein